MTTIERIKARYFAAADAYELARMFKRGRAFAAFSAAYTLVSGRLLRYTIND